MNQPEDILCCNRCGGDLKKVKKSFECVRCKKIYNFRNEIFECLDEEKNEKLFSRIKWDDFYTKYVEDIKKVESKYKDGIKALNKYKKITKKTVYLELGCGTFYLGNVLAGQCALVIGIDFSLKALRVAKRELDKRKIKNYLLIHGDIFKIPLKNKVVDVIYGGGVLEHFKDTAGCIKEYSRITKKDGVVVNAVPMVNMASLTY
jgi:ubiquinone/menaquinone biosynthesis C-methylase UbiE